MTTNNIPTGSINAEAVPMSIEALHAFRKQIDACIQKAESSMLVSGHREMALVRTKLQEAKMWCGKVLEAYGSELPQEFRDKPISYWSMTPAGSSAPEVQILGGVQR